jgi:hypothetical protein
MASPAELPNVAEVVARVLRNVPRERQPLLIALAERLAAERYRGWSGEFLGCAGLEEENASSLESIVVTASARASR